MSTPRSAAPVPGVRTTAQRTAVARLLTDTSEFRTAREIHDQLRHNGEGIGLTTVYRTLQSLADTGAIDVIRTGTGELAYRRCSQQHHHHLVCRNCGRTVEITDAAIERWADQVAGDNGFTDINHTLEISGTCANCTQ